MNKQKLPLVIAISLPIIMIVIVAISMHIPRIAAKPQHNFVYAIGEDMAYRYYSVQNGMITQTDHTPPYYQTHPADMKYPEPKLYLYDVSKDTSTALSLADAQRLRLDSNAKSPDGFEIVRGGGDGGIFGLFFGSPGDYNSQYIRGHGYSKKLNPTLESQNYYYSFRVVGWVK
jgi:hypothetical protein